MPLGRHHYCCICHSYVGRFLPYGKGSSGRAPLMTALAVIGSDIDNFSCPKCGCHDRERHLYLYMQNLEILNDFAGSAILHFAPEKNLQRFVEQQQPKQYVKADLYPVTGDVDKVDMLDMPYDDKVFDYVIANHVLEHVSEYEKALLEIRRVLVDGGVAILQTPYSKKLEKTFSDPGIDDDFSRFQAYGQEDHVRLYGKDIFDLIESHGFESHVKNHAEVLSTISARQYGVNVEEPLFLFQRSVRYSKFPLD